ncbi:MAG: 5-methyltetrahydropteroyltriglutamate--homocysteine S-methyltransferase, partial [Gemmatales bacterium]|nr:5-methyltetrahydropteroyltriglutamate--homocysteine S-methyltransferase [Gemmatales bacterium]
PPAVWERLSFAQEKLEELRILARYVAGDAVARSVAEETHRLWQQEPLGIHPPTRQRIAALTEKDFHREKPYSERQALQREVLKLPPFPTTTIGSFPQTEDLRSLRKAYREG